MTYENGQPWAICDRCGMQRRLKALRTEWTNLRVCDECYDPRPPELDPPRIVPEGLTLPGARPEPPDTFIEDDAPVTPGDL